MINKILYLIFGLLCTFIIPLGLLGIGIYFANRQEKNK
jgi:hypothetical protein